MLANSFFAATVILLAAGFYLLDQCRFLIPYRKLIFGAYGGRIALFTGLLFANLLAGIFALSRRFFLKDTGRKLAHLEKQLRSPQSISAELTRKIRGEE
jgi:hypothetical protein